MGSNEEKMGKMIKHALNMIHKDAADAGDRSGLQGVVFDVVRKTGLDTLGIGVRELAQKYLDALKGGEFATEEIEVIDQDAVDNSKPNKLFNLGLGETMYSRLERAILEGGHTLEEAPKQSHPAVVLDRVADRSDSKPFPVKFYDGSVLNVTPAQARAFMDVYYKMDDLERTRADKYLKTKNGFREYLKLNKVEEKLHHAFPVFENMDEQTLEIIGKLGKHMHGNKLKEAIGTIMKSRGYDPKTGKRVEK